MKDTVVGLHMSQLVLIIIIEHGYIGYNTRTKGLHSTLQIRLRSRVTYLVVTHWAPRELCSLPKLDLGNRAKYP